MTFMVCSTAWAELFGSGLTAMSRKMPPLSRGFDRRSPSGVQAVAAHSDNSSAASASRDAFFFFIFPRRTPARGHAVETVAGNVSRSPPGDPLDLALRAVGEH